MEDVFQPRRPLSRADSSPGLLHIERWERAHPGLVVGFTTRIGGTSRDEMDSLNMALHVADDPARVAENRRLVAEELGFPAEAWTCAEQVHDCRVAVVGKGDRGSGLSSRESAIQSRDAMITREKGVLLAAFYADCVPLVFYDPERQAVGVAHAGWKGTALNVAAETVREMESAFGTRPDRLLAAIGPAIGGCCYEVNGPVVEAVADRFEREGIAPMPRNIALPRENGRYLLDLKQANRQFMIKAGILPTNIEISNLCTSCRPDLFYSHRRDGGKTGRMAAFIGMSEVSGT